MHPRSATLAFMFSTVLSCMGNDSLPKDNLCAQGGTSACAGADQRLDDENSFLQTVKTLASRNILTPHSQVEKRVARDMAHASIHDVMWPADYVIPSEGAEMCLYSKLPEDQVYQATGFGWTASKLPNWVMAMMFTISDEAVRQLQEATGTDLSRPWPCGYSFFTAMYAGGYMLFQQGGEEFELPADQGFLLGKGTARRHALVRWKYVASPDGQAQQDHAAGFHIHLTTNLRAVNVGEAKFALKGGGGSDTLNIPPGEPAWVHYTQSTLQASNQVWRGEGVQLLSVKPIGRLGYKVRILEATGGGTFSRPDSDKKKKTQKTRTTRKKKKKRPKTKTTQARQQQNEKTTKHTKTKKKATNTKTDEGEYGEEGESYKMCSLPHPANQLLEEGNFKEIFSLTFTEDQKWYDVNEQVVIKHGNSYRVEYWYDTTNETCHTINGFGPCTSGFDLHFFYKELAGNNEPFPGYVMDQGPWFMRTPNIDSATASSMLAEWRQDPAHGPESGTYGCPNGQRLPLGV
eukprot:TRINITY_DN1239_c0_g1_i1.p1 TRINITY_DN1239_c0_g1~~TRINITY_DN1239_c0_g1_i1.p1  ORF type:complete len:517 (-),score=78.51 TRINITY_DN1239_c0_g1_i1:162-1712(-)